MIIKGRLNLSAKNDDYIMFHSGRSVNINEILNLMLMDDVYVCVRNLYTDKVLFNEEGKIIKDKVSACYYLYHINNKDLDTILWNNVGNRLMICIENITKQ